jgi:hypothetical protein
MNVVVRASRHVSRQNRTWTLSVSVPCPSAPETAFGCSLSRSVHAQPQLQQRRTLLNCGSDAQGDPGDDKICSSSLLFLNTATSTGSIFPAIATMLVSM